MPSTHTALYFHVVFSTKNREPWLANELRPKLHAYLGGTVRGLGGVALAVGGVADHVHVLMGLGATHRLSDVLRELKSEASAWAKSEFAVPSFAWQEGYGAFTVSPPDLDKVTSYVRNQEEHHRLRSFQDEYVAMLERGLVEYEAKYLW